MKRWIVPGWLAAFLLASPVSGEPDTVPASAVIESLIWRHQGVTELSATLQRVEHPGQEHGIYFVDESGRFAATQFTSLMGTTINGVSWRDKPAAFQWFDGTELVCDQSGDGTYAQRSTPDPAYALGCPGPIQWRKMPWPVLEKLVGCLRDDPDAEARVEGDRIIVRSKRHNLVVEVNDDSTLAAIQLAHDSASYTRFEYSGTRGAPPDRPAERVVNTLVMQNETKHQATYRYEGWSRAPVPRFDARAMNINVMDPSTRDVFSPEGEFLYNRDDRDALMAGGARPLPWAWIGGGAAALAALGGWWWWRRRG